MPESLKFCGKLIVHTVVALLGTASMESAIGMAFRPQTLAGVLWKEWTLNLLCASVIGFFVWRTWKVSAAMWVWALSAVWFGFGLLLTLLTSHSQTVLIGGGFWSQLSGAACDEGVRAIGCLKFFLFTIPFIRSVSYSAGAYISFLINRTMAQAKGASLS
jgi:hypothetical protein